MEYSGIENYQSKISETVLESANIDIFYCNRFSVLILDYVIQKPDITRATWSWSAVYSETESRHF